MLADVISRLASLSAAPLAGVLQQHAFSGLTGRGKFLFGSAAPGTLASSSVMTEMSVVGGPEHHGLRSPNFIAKLRGPDGGKSELAAVLTDGT